jgi:hypothetical protein
MTLATINTSIVSPISDLRETPMVERFKISIQLIGVKKRCRKSERHIFQLGSIDYNDGSFDQESVTKLVRDFIATNVKLTDSNVFVHLDHVKVKSERGFTSTLWEPFSDLNRRFVILHSNLYTA